MTSQVTSSDKQWAAERKADGAAATMPEQRPLGIRFTSSRGWQLLLANTHLGYYSTAVAAYDAWCLNCAQVAVEEVEAASADAVSAYQRAAAVVATAIDQAAARAERDALEEAAVRAYPALFAARRPAAAWQRPVAARCPCPNSRTAAPSNKVSSRRRRSPPINNGPPRARPTAPRRRCPSSGHLASLLGRTAAGTLRSRTRTSVTTRPRSLHTTRGASIVPTSPSRRSRPRRPTP